MKKRKKNILPGAALAALVAAIIVYCIMLNVEKNALSAYEKGAILVAAKDMPRGLVLTEDNVKGYLEEKEMDKRLIPEAAITETGQLCLQMTAGELDKGTMITQSLFINLEEMHKNMKEPVAAGFKADDLYQVVSGTLRSGDHIHIYTVDSDTGDVYLTWENVFVKEVFDSAGVLITAEDATSAAQRVNILMEKENIEQFYSELARGSLRVVKVIESGGGNNETGL